MNLKQVSFMIVTFILAICLSIIPLPAWANWLRPAWVILVLCYWIMQYPSYINLGVGWFLGLLLDALYGTILGEHALAITIVAYLMFRAQRLLRHYPISQQAFFLVLCCLVYNLVLYVVQFAIGLGVYDWRFWISPLLSMFLWPLIVINFNKITYGPQKV